MLWHRFSVRYSADVDAGSYAAIVMVGEQTQTVLLPKGLSGPVDLKFGVPVDADKGSWDADYDNFVFKKL